MSLTPINAISAMVAPVVLLTVGSLISNGLLLMYNGINARLREMTRERIDLLTGPAGDILDVSRVSNMGRERLQEIKDQIPILLRRHHMTRLAVIIIYIAVLGVSIIFIAVAVGEDTDAVARAALALVLAGTIVMIAGIGVAAVSLARSGDAVIYAVERTRSLAD